MSLSLDLSGTAKTVAATPAEEARLRKAFDTFDVDGSGAIDAQEVEALLRALGQDPTPYEVASMVSFADEDGNGTIEFSEFCKMYGKTVEVGRSDAHEDLFQVFKVFDVDGNGYIDRQELHNIMSGLGTKSFRAPEPSMVDELIKEADKDGDGRINYNEFVNVMLNKAGPWS